MRHIIAVMLISCLLVLVQGKQYIVSYNPKRRSIRGFRGVLADVLASTQEIKGETSQAAIDSAIDSTQQIANNLFKINSTKDEAENLLANPDIASIEEDVVVTIPGFRTIRPDSIPDDTKAGASVPNRMDINSIIANFVPQSPFNFNKDYKAWEKQRYAPWHLGRISSIGANPQNYFPYGQEYFYPEMPNDVVVYVVDSGVDESLGELSGRVRLGENFVEDEQHVDYVGHGTGMATLAVGLNNGVAKKAKIVSVKVLNRYKKGPLSALLAGLDWIISDKKESYPDTPAIINFSINLNNTSPSLATTFKQVHDSGILVVSSAGNYKSDACNFPPSGYAEAITVGSFTPSRNQFDNQFSNFGGCIDILAPGINVFVGAAYSANKIVSADGTSLSAAIVTGVGALLLSNYPKLGPDDVKDIILKGAISGQINSLPNNTTSRAIFNGYLGSTSTVAFN